MESILRLPVLRNHTTELMSYYCPHKFKFYKMCSLLIPAVALWPGWLYTIWWSEFLATDPEARVRFPALPEKKVVSLERGSLSHVSTTEELLDRKVAAPV
jgi:hypothetical protein